MYMTAEQTDDQRGPHTLKVTVGAVNRQPKESKYICVTCTFRI